MTEINNTGFNPNVQAYGVAPKADKKEVQPQQEEQTAQVSKEDASKAQDAYGRAFVNTTNAAASANGATKTDNHDEDMKTMLNNPNVVNTSDTLYKAAEKAGVNPAEAATVATAPAK